MKTKYLDMEIDEVPLDDLIPTEYNPRKPLSLGEKRALRHSIEKFGMVYPLVVNARNSHIVGGHQRYVELRELGYETVPVVWVDMDEEQEKRANIQLNSIEADWDLEKLQELVHPMTTDEVENLGFTRVEASALLAGIFMNPDSKQAMLDELKQEREQIRKEPVEREDEIVFMTCPKCGYRGPAEEFGIQDAWQEITEAISEGEAE